MNAYYVFTCNFAHIFIVTFMEKLNHANSNVVHTKLERNSRSKAEKSRQVLNRELEDIAAKLEESGLKKSLLPIQFEVK